MDDKFFYKLVISQLTYDGYRHIAGILGDSVGVSPNVLPCSQLRRIVKVCVKLGKECGEVEQLNSTEAPAKIPQVKQESGCDKCAAAIIIEEDIIEDCDPESIELVNPQFCSCKTKTSTENEPRRNRLILPAKSPQKRPPSNPSPPPSRTVHPTPIESISRPSAPLAPPNLPANFQPVTPLGKFSIIPIHALQVRSMVPVSSLQQISFSDSQMVPLHDTSQTLTRSLPAIEGPTTNEQSPGEVMSSAQQLGITQHTSDIAEITEVRSSECQQIIRQSQLEQANLDIRRTQKSQQDSSEIKTTQQPYQDHSDKKRSHQAQQQQSYSDSKRTPHPQQHKSDILKIQQHQQPTSEIMKARQANSKISSTQYTQLQQENSEILLRGISSEILRTQQNEQPNSDILRPHQDQKRKYNLKPRQPTKVYKSRPKEGRKSADQPNVEINQSDLDSYHTSSASSSRVLDNMPSSADNLLLDHIPHEDIPRYNIRLDNVPRDNMARDNMSRDNMPRAILCEESWIKKEAESDGEDIEEKFVPFKKEMLDEEELYDKDPSKGYFKCHDCDKVFQEICYLKTHITKIHRKDAVHICPHCNKAFVEKRFLVQHMKYHLLNKPFKCTLCFKGFLKPSDLKRHIMIHTGERPYVCDVCRKGFIQYTTMYDHRKKHNVARETVMDPKWYRTYMGEEISAPTPLADSLLKAAVDERYQELGKKTGSPEQHVDVEINCETTRKTLNSTTTSQFAIFPYLPPMRTATPISTTTPGSTTAFSTTTASSTTTLLTTTSSSTTPTPRSAEGLSKRRKFDPDVLFLNTSSSTSVLPPIEMSLPSPPASAMSLEITRGPQSPTHFAPPQTFTISLPIIPQLDQSTRSTNPSNTTQIVSPTQSTLSEEHTTLNNLHEQSEISVPPSPQTDLVQLSTSAPDQSSDMSTFDSVSYNYFDLPDSVSDEMPASSSVEIATDKETNSLENTLEELVNGGTDLASRHTDDTSARKSLEDTLSELVAMGRTLTNTVDSGRTNVPNVHVPRDSNAVIGKTEPPALDVQNVPYDVFETAEVDETETRDPALSAMIGQATADLGDDDVICISDSDGEAVDISSGSIEISRQTQS